jgi:hypothetical protein
LAFERAFGLVRLARRLLLPASALEPITRFEGDFSNAHKIAIRIGGG